MENIDLIDIEAELKKLWIEAKGKQKTRASLFNLIFYATTNNRFEFYHKIIDSIINRFPSRIILICLDEKATLQAKVSAKSIGNQDSPIYCEIIEVFCNQTYLDRIPYLILPYLAPDLPIYCLWSMLPSKDQVILPRLIPYVNRVIFDSEAIENLNEFAESVIQLADTTDTDIGDLNWSAFSGFRGVIREVFSSPNTKGFLETIDHVEIIYNKNPCPEIQHNTIEACYFQSWLANKLRWSFKAIDISEGTINLSYTSSHPISVSIGYEKNSHLLAGTLLKVTIKSKENQGVYHFKRDDLARQISVSYSDDSICQIPSLHPMGGQAEGEEIIQELFYSNAQSHYYAMLKSLKTINWTNKAL